MLRYIESVLLLLENVWAMLTSVTVGRSVCESFATLDHDGSWLKTYGGYCQLMLDGSLEKYSGSWPKWGMMLDGECTEPPMSERRTKGTDCTLWPTIVATEAAHGSPNQRDSRGRPGLTAAALWPTVTLDGNYNRKGVSNTSGDGLATAVNNWSTPNTMDALPPKSQEAIQREVEVTRKGRSAPANLRDQVNGNWPSPKAGDAVFGMTARTSNRPIEKSTHLQTQVYLAECNLWPTPKSSDSTRGTYPSEAQRHTPNLESAVKLWPTPKSRDYRSGSSDTKRESPDLNCVVYMKGYENWPTPQTGNYRSGMPSRAIRQSKQIDLQDMVALTEQSTDTWSTPNAADCQGKTGGGQGRSLRTDTYKPAGQLNPDWVECLMGYPVGWTETETAGKFDLFRMRGIWEVFNQCWPARRGEPQQGWEPPRVVIGMKGRATRIKMLGNAVVPQWAYISLRMIAEIGGLNVAKNIGWD